MPKNLRARNPLPLSPIDCQLDETESVWDKWAKVDRKPDPVMAPTGSHSDHSSCPVIAHGVERPYPRVMGGPPDPPIWSCSRWGLPSVHHR